MPEENRIKDVSKMPSLKGRLPSKDVHLTEMEKAALQDQGLLDDDGRPTDEAIVQPDPMANLPPGVERPVPLEDLVPDSSVTEEAVAEAKGEHAPEAEVDADKQVAAGLAAPVDDEDETLDPGLPPGEAELGSATVPLGALIQQSTDPVNCGRCGFDLRQTFVEPRFEASDKASFIRHIMSKDGRFYKEYEIFDGAMKIRFRSRSQHELDMILDEGRRELKKEDLAGIGDLTAQVQRYHVAASVDRISGTAADEEVTDFELLSEVGNVKKVDETVFGTGRSSGLYNVVMALWMEFERLYGWFSSKAHDPDFWKAADGDR